MLSSYLLTLIKKPKIREGSYFLTLCRRKCAKCSPKSLAFCYDLCHSCFPCLKLLVVLSHGHFHPKHILVVSEASF